MAMTSSFLFFGCWNREKKNHTIPPRDVVLAALKMHEPDEAHDAVIVAGDNIYSVDSVDNSDDQNIVTIDKKDGKKKYYDLATVDTAFKSLKDSTKSKLRKNDNIHIVLGNHNVADDKILHREQDRSSTLNLTLYNHNAYKDDLVDRVRFLFINTNHIKSAETLSNFVGRNLNTSGNVWNIVVGHHPILATKTTFDENSKKHKVKQASLVGSKELLNVMLPHRAVYMCADVHMFQAGVMSTRLTQEMSRGVPQIVVGTGGAKPDKFAHDAVEKSCVATQKTDVNGSLQTLPQCMQYTLHAVHDPYGYCSVRVSNENLVVTYRRVKDHTVGHDIEDVATVTIAPPAGDGSGCSMKTQNNKSPKTLACVCKKSG